jgi:hypothetical protein
MITKPSCENCGHLRDEDCEGNVGAVPCNLHVFPPQKASAAPEAPSSALATTAERTTREGKPCPKCNGQGWTAEHNPDGRAHDDEGNCMPGCCPIQVPCEACSGTGRVLAHEATGCEERS